MKDLERASVRDAVSKAFTVKLGAEALGKSVFSGITDVPCGAGWTSGEQAGGEVLLVSATPDVFVEATQAHLGTIGWDALSRQPTYNHRRRF